jgi:CheY-specific phosphatase CheX
VDDRLLAEALSASVEEVLERMFFVRSFDDAPGDGEPRWISAGLRFEGDPPGAMQLRLSAAAARSIAADFLAAEEADLTEAQVEEVICELANMICGSVLSRVESQTTFRLSSPWIEQPGQARPEGPAGNTASCTLNISHGTLTATIHTKALACRTAEYAF